MYLFGTGLNEQEKESLIKFIVTQGVLALDEEGNKVFVLNQPLQIDNKFTPAFLIEKVFNNIQKEVAIKIFNIDKEDFE
jgi:hypothetical protein